MKIAATALSILAVLVSAGLAQASLPDSVASAPVTRAEYLKLIAENGELSVEVVADAREIGKDARVIRALAIDIFDAQPGLSVDQYRTLIRDGAPRLVTALAAAKALDPGADPQFQALKQKIVDAVEAGRLTRARDLQDQFNAAFAAALDQATEKPRLALAAGYASAGDDAFAIADYLGAAERYARAAATAPLSEQHIRWNYLSKQANALEVRGIWFGEPDRFRQAINLYKITILPLSPRASMPVDWAKIENDLGLAQMDLGETGFDEDLTESIKSYRAALEVRTKYNDPKGWAETLTNLGWALQVLGKKRNDEALRQSIAAYRNAFEVRTKTSDPKGWAQTQNQMGNALRILGERGDDQALKDAITAFRGALEVRTRDGAPADWAATQDNLGSALLILGQRGDDQALNDASTAFRGALEVSTRERGDDQALKDAITAFRGALEVYTRDRAPAAWAKTMNNLGNALRILGERGDDQALEDAITAFRGALEVRTRDRAPADWALIQNNLGYALEMQGDKGGGLASYEAAVECYKRALEVFTPESNRTAHDRTQRNLERNLRIIATKPKF